MASFLLIANTQGTIEQYTCVVMCVTFVSQIKKTGIVSERENT